MHKSIKGSSNIFRSHGFVCGQSLTRSVRVRTIIYSE